MIILSYGKRSFSLEGRVKNPISNERIPTRPKNMAKQRTTLDVAESVPVMPREDPTVNSADALSNNSALTDNVGSSKIKINESRP